MVAVQKNRGVHRFGGPPPPPASPNLHLRPSRCLLIQCGQALLTQTSGEGWTAVTRGVPVIIIIFIIIIIIYGRGFAGKGTEDGRG